MQANKNTKNDPELTENDAPKPGEIPYAKAPSYHEKTRTSLALIIVFVALFLQGAVIIGYLISGGERFDALAQTALGGVQSLLSLIVGFYFAQVVSLEK